MIQRASHVGRPLFVKIIRDGENGQKGNIRRIR